MSYVAAKKASEGGRTPSGHHFAGESKEEKAANRDRYGAKYVSAARTPGGKHYPLTNKQMARGQTKPTKATPHSKSATAIAPGAAKRIAKGVTGGGRVSANAAAALAGEATAYARELGKKLAAGKEAFGEKRRVTPKMLSALGCPEDAAAASNTGKVGVYRNANNAVSRAPAVAAFHQGLGRGQVSDGAKNAIQHLVSSHLQRQAEAARLVSGKRKTLKGRDIETVQQVSRVLGKSC
jgi:histone H3/H4